MTVTFASLWLPILLAAVAVWFWAFLSWAVLPLHKRDFGKLPNEDGFLNSMKSMGIPQGAYGFPYCSDNKERNNPEFVAKWKSGPAGMLNVWNPNASMGMNMVLSFLVYLIVSAMIAYLAASAGMPRGAGFSRALQVIGTAGVLAYTFAALPQMIWFQANANAKM